MNIESVIQTIQSIETSSQLNQFFSDISYNYSYDWSGLVIFTPIAGNHYQTNFFGQIPTELQQQIQQDAELRRYCLMQTNPICYRELRLQQAKRTKQTQLQQLIIPINGVANQFCCLVFSLPTQQQPDRQVLEKIGWYWLMLSSFIYAQYQQHIGQKQHNMTRREMECIRWAAEGKTSWEISQLLSISQRTVDFHLANCISKTNSVNRQQAIVKCALSGQLVNV